MFVVFPRFRLRLSVFAVPLMLLMVRLEGLLPFFVMLASALFHELGHLLALAFCGFKPRRIDIFPMGALIVAPEGLCEKDEITIALAGPLFSLLTSLLSSVWFALSGGAIALFALIINFVFAVFNLMPDRRSDGGKALYNYLSLRKTPELTEAIVSWVSFLSKGILLSVSLCALYLTDFNLGIALLSLSLFCSFFDK